MSGWERTHRRYRLVYAVAEDISKQGPEAKGRWRQKIEAEFGGLDSFLLDVRRRWLMAIEARSEDGPMHEIHDAAVRGNRSLWALISAFADHSVIAGLRGLRVAAETA